MLKEQERLRKFLRSTFLYKIYILKEVNEIYN